MISSSRRVIKRSAEPASRLVETYIPPVEITVSGQGGVAHRAVFPRYSLDGKPLDIPVVGAFLLPDGEEGEEQGLSGEEQALAEEFARRREEIQQMLEDAKREASEIIENAMREAQELKEAAQEQGFREGYERGSSDGRSSAVELYRKENERQKLIFREDMQRALKSVELAKEKCLNDYLDELKDCAIAVGEKVVQISLRSSGEVIRRMIVSATEKLKKTAWVKIYIDKYDYDLMMEADGDVADELSHLSDNIKFVVMDKAEGGSCIIEMPEEIVDVSVNTQIENIRDILENVRR